MTPAIPPKRESITQEEMISIAEKAMTTKAKDLTNDQRKEVCCILEALTNDSKSYHLTNSKLKLKDITDILNKTGERNTPPSSRLMSLWKGIQNLFGRTSSKELQDKSKEALLSQRTEALTKRIYPDVVGSSLSGTIDDKAVRFDFSGRKRRCLYAIIHELDLAGNKNICDKDGNVKPEIAAKLVAFARHLNSYSRNYSPSDIVLVGGAHFEKKFLYQYYFNKCVQKEELMKLLLENTSTTDFLNKLREMEKDWQYKNPSTTDLLLDDIEMSPEFRENTFSAFDYQNQFFFHLRKDEIYDGDKIKSQFVANLKLLDEHIASKAPPATQRRSNIKDRDHFIQYFQNIDKNDLLDLLISSTNFKSDLTELEAQQSRKDNDLMF